MIDFKNCKQKFLVDNPDIDLLLTLRKESVEEKDTAAINKFNEELLKEGIIAIDTPQGQFWDFVWGGG